METKVSEYMHKYEYRLSADGSWSVAFQTLKGTEGQAYIAVHVLLWVHALRVTEVQEPKGIEVKMQKFKQGKEVRWK